MRDLDDTLILSVVKIKETILVSHEVDPVVCPALNGWIINEPAGWRAIKVHTKKTETFREACEGAAIVKCWHRRTPNMTRKLLHMWD
jgi:hypothetical protein